MKFRTDLITNILNNQNSFVENTIRSIHSSERVVIAQGYGASSQVPRRFLAYAVPVLRLASQLSEMTTVEFYFATHGVHRVNGIFHTESLSRMRDELSWFTETYYPRLLNRVQVMEDVPLSSETKNVIDVLFVSAKRVVESAPQIRQFVSSRGGDNAIRYMLEHLLYMRDPIIIGDKPNTELLVPAMSTNHDHVIMVGGPSEKVFWQFRQAMLKECGCHTKWKSHQFFTTIGDPPTYHMYAGEPVLNGNGFEGNLFTWLKNLPGEFGKQKNLIRDYSVLLQEFARVEIFKLSQEVDSTVLNKGEEVLTSRYSSH